MTEVFILGPEQMAFQTVKAPILDDTLKLVADYQNKLRILNTDFAKDAKDLQDRYNRAYNDLINNTNKKLTAFFVDKETK